MHIFVDPGADREEGKIPEVCTVCMNNEKVRDETDALSRQCFGHLWTNALTSFVVLSSGNQLVKDDHTYNSI